MKQTHKKEERINLYQKLVFWEELRYRKICCEPNKGKTSYKNSNEKGDRTSHIKVTKGMIRNIICNSMRTHLSQVEVNNILEKFKMPKLTVLKSLCYMQSCLILTNHLFRLVFLDMLVLSTGLQGILFAKWVVKSESGAGLLKFKSCLYHLLLHDLDTKQII